MMDFEQVKRYMAEDVIEVVPLAYMRGRTLNNAFIIMDEAQNTTVPQMKMFLTRMGLKSKVVVSGDTSQVDLPSHTKSGLIDAIGRLRDIEGFANVVLGTRTLCGIGWCRKLLARTRRARRRNAKARLNRGVSLGDSMSTGSKKKRRIDRVTSVELPPGVLGTLVGHLRRGHVLVRLAMCAITALLLWGDHARLGAALPYHLGDVPRRDVWPARNSSAEDPEATRRARKQARSLAIATYDQDPPPLEQLRAKLENEVTELVAAKISKVRQVWDEFRLPLAEGTPEPTPEEREQQFRSSAKR